jgi:hypothetical protein
VALQVVGHGRDGADANYNPFSTPTQQKNKRLLDGDNISSFGLGFSSPSLFNSVRFFAMELVR